MAKSLDGIKKLNPDDIKKYRKIVLNYIGEKDSAGVDEQKKSSQGALSSRKVDGINLNKINRFVAKEEIRLKKFSARSGFPPASLASLELGRSGPVVRPVGPASPEPRLSGLPTGQADRQVQRGEQAGVLGGKKEELIKSRQEEEERLKEAIKRQEEERGRIKEEEGQYQMKKEQAEWAEKLRLEELEKEEKRRVKENIRLEKMKRKEEIKRMKQEMKIAKQAARGKKRIKRQKAWRKIKRNYNLKLNNFFSKIKQNIIYIILFLILFLAITYIVFCLAVLRFKTNNLIGWAANYLPVPAVITSQGVINYNDFKKIENKNYLNLSLLEKKNYLAEWVILRDLREKYGLPAKPADDDLAIKYVLDKDFNQVGLSRINKISELLKGQSDIGQLDKYADEYSDGAYYDNISAVEKFGSTVLELVVGQTNKIIPRVNGYYIIKRIDDKENQFGLKYLFIRAQTLDQYVSKKSGETKVFILAN